MTPNLDHRALRAAQGMIGIGVIAVASGARYALLTAGAAGAVLRIRQRGTRTLAVATVTAVALTTLLTIGSRTADRRAHDKGTVVSHHPHARTRARDCRCG